MLTLENLQTIQDILGDTRLSDYGNAVAYALAQKLWITADAQGVEIVKNAIHLAFKNGQYSMAALNFRLC